MPPRTKTEDDLEIDDIKNKCSDLDKSISILRAEFTAHAEYTKDALEKAEQLMNARLEGMNEFRDQLKTQAATFVTFPVFEERHKSINSKIEDLQKGSWKMAGGFAILALVIGIAIPFILKLIP